MTRQTCHYCGLAFSGPGCSPDGRECYCCHGCYLVERILASRGEQGLEASIVLRLGVGAFLAMNVMMLSMPLYLQTPAELGPDAVQALKWAMAVLSVPAVILLGGPFLIAGIRQARQMHLSMDSLICTGCIAAFSASLISTVRGYGPVYFDTATMLPLVITVGRLIEANAKTRTSRAIRDAIDIIPPTACLLRDGVETRLPTKEITAGDTILVRPGERIPVDGVIAEGSCLVEESAFTGEPLPRPCRPGDRVHGGSVDCDGPIILTASGPATDSLIARMKQMIEQAQSERAPVERLAERAASVFVPVVWLIAAAALVYWGWIGRDVQRGAMSAMAVLVVACPCALGIATPLAVCIAIGRAAAAGVLIGSGAVLERLPAVRRVFFDKTGTLTEDSISVSEIAVYDPALTESEALAWAAGVAAKSEHAISRAIAGEASRRDIAPGQASDVTVHPGLGVSATVTIGGQSRRVSLGSLRLFPDCRIPKAGEGGLVSGFPLRYTPLKSRNTGQGFWMLKRVQHDVMPENVDSRFRGNDKDYDAANGSAAFVCWDGQIRAAIYLQDTPRPDAQSAIEELVSAGIVPAVISGDREGPVRRIADQIGIPDAFHECGPEEKVEMIAKARAAGGAIAMVGDGINDAPALAAADIGIAIGSGTDLARQSGDITLMGNELSRIPWLIELARETRGVIRRNLAWAFGYNCAAIALAFMGFVHPLIAAAAMVLSSLSVVASSMRLTRWSPPARTSKQDQ